MVAPYNFTGLANQTSLISVLRVSNGFVDGLWGVFVIIAVGLMVYFGLRMFEPTRESLVATSFSMVIVAFLMRILGLVQNGIVVACVVLLIGSVVMLINKE